MIMGFHSWIHFVSIWFSIWNSASISVSMSFSIWISLSISVSGFQFQTPFGLSFLLDGMENGKRNGRCFSNGKQHGKLRRVQNGTRMENTVCFPFRTPLNFAFGFPCCFPSRNFFHFVFHFLSTPEDLCFLFKFPRIRPFRLPSWLPGGKTEWNHKWKAT